MYKRPPGSCWTACWQPFRIVITSWPFPRCSAPISSAIATSLSGSVPWLMKASPSIYAPPWTLPKASPASSLPSTPSASTWISTPHVHALVADGLFLRDTANEPFKSPLAPPAPPTPASDPQSSACPTFLPLPKTGLSPLEELFRAKVIHLLLQEKLLPPERVQVLYSWKHSGFNLHAGQPMPPEAKADLEDLAQFILRNPFSVEKMTLESPGDLVIYRSRLNARINRNFEVFTPTDFLAAITQHIPEKGAQMIRYYGWYSNKMRGVRQRGLPPERVFRRPGGSPPPPAKLPSKRWRDLILRVWHVDRSVAPSAKTPCGSSP
jgi:hypothetical protein